MSIKAIAKVWEYEGIDPRNKFVLIAYADHADHDGRNVFPAVATVAEKTCYSERTVQRATRELEEAGLLTPDGEGPKGTNRWRVNMAWGGDNLTPLEGGDNLSGVTSTTERGDSLTPEPSLTVNTTLSKDRVGAAKPHPIRDLLAAAETVWGYATPNGGKEAAAAKKLLKAHSQDEIVACLRWASQEPFYQDKHLSLQIIVERIGPWVSLGRPQTWNGGNSNGRHSQLRGAGRGLAGGEESPTAIYGRALEERSRRNLEGP